ncbi:hypothetical protein BGZ81_001478, partial [Podila clonocystis]
VSMVAIPFSASLTELWQEPVHLTNEGLITWTEERPAKELDFAKFAPLIKDRIRILREKAKTKVKIQICYHQMQWEG